jgi:hypothetical protein
MEQEYVEKFNPLSKGPTNPEYQLGYARNGVRSVIDSYHGRIDVFAEAIQNSIDAIERRWSDSDGSRSDESDLDSKPRLRIILNSDQNAIEVIDNGVGIAADKLEDLLEPFVTDKRLSGSPTRGHKGVGTTFLAYGHPRFEIHTKTEQMSEAVGYYMEGGRQWAMSENLSAPPDYFRVKSTHPGLSAFASGTYIKINLDQHTNLKSLTGVIHNTPIMWASILSSTTAAGNVAVGVQEKDRPVWTREIKITIEHWDGAESAKFSFTFPHSSVPKTAAKELQDLQNTITASPKREFELIYIERSHAALKTLLGSRIAFLENSIDENDQAILSAFNRYEVSVYASLAYKNTFYEEQFAKLIKKTGAEKFSLAPGFGGGVMVASVGMPMGALQPHLAQTMQPQERRRYFLLIHFNDRYSPDIGRKTIPQAVEPLVSELEHQLLKLLRTQDKRLLRDKADDTRPKGNTYAKATQELTELAKQIAGLEKSRSGVRFDGVILQRAPEWEPEVVALFQSLVDSGVLPGYVIRGIPGGTSRYDALFDYRLRPGDQDDVPDGLQVHIDGVDSTVTLSTLWLEFKKSINDFIDDLGLEAGAPSKKYFNHVHLLVAWSILGVTSDKYAVVPIDKDNWKDRKFVGSTHFLIEGDNDHRVEIICLKELLTIIYGGDE